MQALPASSSSLAGAAPSLGPACGPLQAASTARQAHVRRQHGRQALALRQQHCCLTAGAAPPQLVGTSSSIDGENSYTSAAAYLQQPHRKEGS